MTTRGDEGGWYAFAAKAAATVLWFLLGAGFIALCIHWGWSHP